MWGVSCDQSSRLITPPPVTARLARESMYDLLKSISSKWIDYSYADFYLSL